MRWSLRKTYEMRPWQPKYPHEIIQDGDEVYLFCHSMLMGMFRDPEMQPPKAASPVCYSSIKQEVRAFSPALPRDNKWHWSQIFDEGRDGGINDRELYKASDWLGDRVHAEATKWGSEPPSVFSSQRTWAGAIGAPKLDFIVHAAFGLPDHSTMLTRMSDEGGFEPLRFKVKFV
jgi:hypothetical protein